MPLKLNPTAARPREETKPLVDPGTAARANRQVRRA